MSLEIEIIRRIEEARRQLDDLNAKESEAGTGGTTVASQAEVDAGTDNAKIVTPLTLVGASTVLHGDERINVGDGIEGGGTLSSNPTVSLDIDGLTAEASADNADTIAIYDNTASALHKQSRTNFLSGIGGWPFNNIKTVSAAAGATYASIVAAITGMTAGDIILVDAGTWTSSLTMSKAGAFIALNPEKTTITTGTTDDTIDVTADNVIIDGFTITNSKTGADRACITSGNDNLIVKNCLIAKTGAATNSYGIRNTGGANWKIEDVTVTVSGGTNNYAFKADTAASETAIGGGSYTGVEGHIYVGHTSADIVIQGEPLIGGIVASDVILTDNASGLTANFGDVGILDEAGDYDDTATEADNVAWCIALTDSIANAQILIKRRGNAIVNYTGSAPSAGEFLITSTTSGDAKLQATMHPAIFAVCTANGAGGQVAVQLLTGTVFVPKSSSIDICQVTASDSSDFIALIHNVPSAPSATIVYYDTISVGAENVIKPVSSSELAKLVLWNTTRGTSRLIESVDTGLNKITTVSSVDSWANNDSITSRSQTVITGAANEFVDLDFTQQSVIPLLARSVAIAALKSDSGATGQSIVLHSLVTFASSKQKTTQNWIIAAGTFHTSSRTVDLINQQCAIRYKASGAATQRFILRLDGYYLAVP